MRVKKVFKIVTAFVLFCSFAGFVTTATTQVVNAKSFAQKNHLKAYTIPKQFRGTWHRGKSKLRITSRSIAGWKTYHPKKRLKTYKNPGKILFVEKHGKELIYYPFQASGMGIYRKGKNLIQTGMGQHFTYHR